MGKGPEPVPINYPQSISPVTAIATGLISRQKLRMKGIQFTRNKTSG